MKPAASPKTPRFIAFQHHDFRAMWLGQLVSVIGNQMQVTAIQWQIFKLLEGQQLSVNLLGQAYHFSAPALGLGAIGLTRIAPIMVFSVLGGMIADTRNRKTVLFVATALAAICAAGLAFASLSGGIRVLWIYLLSAAISATVAFANPARQAIIPNLVPREDLTNAISLNSIAMNVGMVTGPAIAGLLLRTQDPGVVYALNAVSFFGVLVAVLVMRHPGTAPASAPRFNVGTMLDGFRFVRRTPIIWSTMLLDFFATFFSSAQTMLPIVAGDILKLGADGYGILATGQAIGSVLASTALSLRRNIQRQGAVLIGAVVIYGFATALFGISTWAVLSYVLYAATGAADAVSTVIRNTVRQLMTPDGMRGRMVGVNMLFFMGGPQLGEIEAGAVAAAFGVPAAIISGGVATVLLAAWVAWRFPKLRAYEPGKP